MSSDEGQRQRQRPRTEASGRQWDWGEAEKPLKVGPSGEGRPFGLLAAAVPLACLCSPLAPTPSVPGPTPRRLAVPLCPRSPLSLLLLRLLLLRCPSVCLSEPPHLLSRH